jgi:Glycosyl transferase family 2
VSTVKALARRLQPTPLGRVGEWGARRLAGVTPFSGTKQYSAMIRVRNEERYLEPCVLSIVEHVDEVVIIDNRSTDRTPEVVDALCRRYPDKVRGERYEHDVALPGAEDRALLQTPGGAASPRLLANFYNWCVDRCTYPFIVKWDGDMVATSDLGSTFASFRTATEQVMFFFGVNVFRDGRHAVAGVPIADDEPRVFYRRYAEYAPWVGGCEVLESVLLRPRFGLVAHVDRPLYVHMKFCKDGTFANESPDDAAESTAADVPGEPLDATALETIDRWQLANGA